MAWRNRRLRIAVVHSFYSDRQPSGENAVVRDQVQALMRAGYDVTLIDRHTDELQAERFYLPKAATRTATGREATLQRQLSRMRPDVVHVHNTFPNFGTRWLGNVEAPVVATMHNFRFGCSVATWRRDGHDCFECQERGTSAAVRHGCYGNTAASIPLALATSHRWGNLRGFYRNVNTLICLSEQASRIAVEMIPRRGRTVTVPNFVDLPAVDSSSSAEPESDDLLFAGRLAEEKGIAWLLKNLPNGRRLSIVGDGPLREVVERAELENPSIRYLGPRPRAELMSVVQRSQALIVPSLWMEGLPTVILEALRLGTSVCLSSKMLVSTEFARRGWASVFDPEGGAAALRNALEQVTHAEDDDLTREVQIEFSVDLWLRRIEKVYAESLGRI